MIAKTDGDIGFHGRDKIITAEANKFVRHPKYKGV
jgi:hypothetical protein